MAARLREVTLDDKYTLARGRVFMTGVQALVRLPMEQRRRDQAAGRNIAGFVTGYRGSPLGAYDQQLEKASALLKAHHVVHQPGVNEDLAATACQGTQAVGLGTEGRYEGVFAIWYGKGPGVDRSGDAIRHGNLFGSSALGGVLLLLGDDHICESSTTAHQSEYAMVDAMVPILNPSGVREILEYGLLGIAMSRFSGAWVSLKCVHDTVESTASVEVELPDIVVPEEPGAVPGARSFRLRPEEPWPPLALEVERLLHTEKLDAARAFARANRVDRVVLGEPVPGGLTLITAGKSWQDVIAALDLLGIDEAQARELGLCVYKVGMTFPLEPQALTAAVAGADLVMVVEEKRGLIEGQAKEILYGLDRRPAVIGKRDEAGASLFPSYGQLDVVAIAAEIGRRLVARSGEPALERRVAEIEGLRRKGGEAAGLVRLPWFCPGCPHSTSTHVPEGSKALAGIGCHFMTTWMGRETTGFTQMGGEGGSWLGRAPFTHREHVFQNVGDGTFYHSGSMAVRAAHAAGVTITFKLLYNDAVAMTGGQKMETGNLSVPQITHLFEAEGVTEIAVVTDEPGKYPAGTAFAPGVKVYGREDLDAVQRRLREVPGVSALIYDQVCAAEKRRRRKRGLHADPDRRVVINELVCEGCGDCGVKSNCVAIQPLDTELGRKRRIDQSACNKDFSCLKGFCPSFVTVHGARLRRANAGAREVPFPVLPEPALPAIGDGYGIMVTGIGGTGVVTIAALLGMAAHLEGKGVVALDMIGMAQKGGAVVSHLKLAEAAGDLGSPRLAAGQADLLLGCDLVVAAGRTALPAVRRGTRVVANTAEVMTGAFTANPDLAYPTERLRRTLADAAGASAVTFVEATRLATALLGDGIATNLFMVGYAWQQGLIPLSSAAILRAIEINGVAATMNAQAFLWGRRAAHDLPAVEAVLGKGEPAESRPRGLDELVEHRARFLADYQDEAYAARYRRGVAGVRQAEERATPGRTALSEAAARSLFKLMAYKDEYEVARLYSDGHFQRRLAEEFEGWDRLEVHLAPPVLARRDPITGESRKRAFGPWMLAAFRLLPRLRRLRGTRLDPFGYTAERRTERALIGEYEELLTRLAGRLDPRTHALAVELAGLPQTVRGFGHVKMKALAQARSREEALLRELQAERPGVPAAA